LFSTGELEDKLYEMHSEHKLSLSPKLFWWHPYMYSFTNKPQSWPWSQCCLPWLQKTSVTRSKAQRESLLCFKTMWPVGLEKVLHGRWRTDWKKKPFIPEVPSFCNLDRVSYLSIHAFFNVSKQFILLSHSKNLYIKF
jgi:hypothetical protein